MDLKPQGDGYQVQARLDRFDVEDKSKIFASTNYTSVMHPGLPPDKQKPPTPLFSTPKERRKRLEAQNSPDPFHTAACCSSTPF